MEPTGALTSSLMTFAIVSLIAVPIIAFGMIVLF
jgi:hypothetical protein